jgi:hypothetical protein
MSQERHQESDEVPSVLKFQSLNERAQLPGIMAERTRPCIGGELLNAVSAKVFYAHFEILERQPARRTTWRHNSQRNSLVPATAANAAILASGYWNGAHEAYFGVYQVQDPVEYPPGVRVG